VLDCRAFGGQAGASARIENYLGFPTGITGMALMARAYNQAQKFGVEMAIPDEAVGLQAPVEANAGEYVLRLFNEERVRARSVVIASGARYRRLALRPDRRCLRPDPVRRRPDRAGARRHLRLPPRPAPNLTLRACESFGRWLHTYLTLRNGAKRSVSKGGNRHGAYAPHDRGNSVLRVPILRDAPLRYAPLHEHMGFGVQDWLVIGVRGDFPGLGRVAGRTVWRDCGGDVAGFGGPGPRSGRAPARHNPCL